MPMRPESLCNCLALRQAARQITQLSDAELAETGPRTTRYSVLTWLSRHGPLTQQELAEALVMKRPVRQVPQELTGHP